MSDLYPFTGHLHDLGGVRLHYLDEGRGEPVVLVHGNPSWSFLYRDLIRVVSRRHRAIAPDHVGCGRSDRPSDGSYDYTLERRIDDLEALLEAIGADRDLHLVMHDWGGAIAMGYAVRHPERIRRLVVLNTAAFHPPAGKRLPWSLRLARDSALGAFLTLRLNAFLLGWLATGCRRRRLPAAVRAGYLAPYGNARERLAILRFVQDIPLRPGDPSWETLSRIDAGLSQLGAKPMLICWGERDFVFDRDYLAEWVRRFPSARVHRFPRAGHLVLEDETTQVVSLVEQFLAGSSS